MSRTAAAILGLTLVALSIGFNTVRYPAVWDMSGPAMASESAPAVAASPSQKTEDPAPALPPQPAASPSLAADRSASVETHSSGNADSTAHAGSFDAPEAQRPLVPVSALGGTELAAGVRRLPPVDRAYSDRIDRSPGNIVGGPIPVYPRTGI